MYEDVRSRVTRPPCFGREDKYDPDDRKCAYECPFRKDCPELIQKRQSLEALKARQESLRGATPPSAPSGFRPPSSFTSSASAPVSSTQGQATSLVRPTTQSATSVAYERNEESPLQELGVRMICAGTSAGLEEASRFFRHDGFRLFKTRKRPVVVRCSACHGMNDEQAKFCTHCGREFES